MTKFAVNYSPQTKILVQENRIKPDLLKLPDWPHLIKDAKPIQEIYIHFDISIGSKRFKEIDWNLVKEIKNQTNTKYINAHISFPKKDKLKKFTKRIYKHLEKMCTLFGSENIIVENPPLSLKRQPFQYISVAPDFTRLLLEQFGCGFVFDISHAVRSARIQHIDEKDLITAYPLEKTKEVHMTGLKWVEKEYMDHYEMQEKDWDIFKWVLDHFNQNAYPQPHIVAFEYSGFGPIFDFRSEIQYIENQVPQFMKIIQDKFPNEA